MAALAWMVLPLALAQSAPPPTAPELPSAPPVVRVDEAPAPQRGLSRVRFGAGLEAGLPTGAALAPFVRPLPWLQVEGSLAHDGAAFGLGGGLTLGALDWHFTPTLSAGAGHFFRGDAASVTSRFGLNLDKYPSARSFDFDHAELQLGFLAGGHSVQFYLRGGMSWVHTTLHDFTGTLQAATGDGTLGAADPTITGWVPSARMGLQLTF